MTTDFSIFLTRDNLIFFAISFAIFVVVAVICFIIVRAIFRFLKSLFKKEPRGRAMEGALSDKGEDLGVYVEELERSKSERLRVQSQQQATMPAKGPVVQYNQPVSGNQAREEVQIDEGKEYAGKTQKDIEAGLGKLKGSEDPDAPEKFQLGSKIKMSGNVSVQGQQDAGGQPAQASKKPKNAPEAIADDKNQIEVPSKTAPNKSSVIQADRMGNLRKDDVKINKAAFSKDLEVLAKARASGEETSKGQPEDGSDSFFEKPEGLKNIPKPVKAKGIKDSSIFGGKPEITRKELKYKLWKDPKVYKAARESLLYLDPAQRAKLEKQLFPQSYGWNISKSDIKTRMHKLSQKMLGEKNPQAKAALRKEIKFIKKIGGIQ